MKAIQYTGPFKQGQILNVQVEDYNYSFVKISIETSSMLPINAFNEPIQPTICFIEPDGTATDFRINENNILEWDRCKYGQFQIVFLEDLDAFTFVNLTFANLKEDF